jgi:ABC-type Fe2+-enterobactin transport system substrate-binding protein
MDASAYLPVTLYAAAIVVVVLAGWGVIEVVKTARSARRLADELYATVPAVLERADSTLTAFNRELARMDGVVTQLEEVSDRVTSTTRAAQELVEVPAAAMSGLANGARRFFEVLFTKNV